MLRIIKSLRNRGDLRRLRERARMDQYPRSYIELCKSLLGLGLTERAMETAREGLERFPHSEDLRDVLRHTWRQTKSSDIERPGRGGPMLREQPMRPAHAFGNVELEGSKPGGVGFDPLAAALEPLRVAVAQHQGHGRWRPQAAVAQPERDLLAEVCTGRGETQ